MTATAFIPSQVISFKKKQDRGIDLTSYTVKQKEKQTRQGKSLLLVPSQSINSANNKNKKNRTKLQETTKDANVDQNDGRKDASTSTVTSTSTLTKTQKKKKKHSFQYYGNLPDVHWR